MLLPASHGEVLVTIGHRKHVGTIRAIEALRLKHYTGWAMKNVTHTQRRSNLLPNGILKTLLNNANDLNGGLREKEIIFSCTKIDVRSPDIRKLNFSIAIFSDVLFFY